MKSILLISFTQLQRDARVSRQVGFLKEKYKVTAVALDMSPDKAVTFIKTTKPKLTLIRKAFLSAFLLLRFYRIAHRLLYGRPPYEQIAKAGPFDLIIANDVESLPVAFAIQPKGKILFDAHEYAPRQFEDRLYWRVFFQHFNIHICRKFIPKVSAMTTVSVGLAEEYEKQFGVKPTLITNAPWFTNVEPSPTQPGKIRMVHHGGAVRARKLEFMIEVVKLLDDRFTLDLILMVPEMASSKTKGYIDELRALAGNDARIQFHPPVALDEVVPHVNRYDVGIYILPPINFNQANSLPNKFFEYVQARLALAIAPTPEMARLIGVYDMGVVSKDFTPQSLANELTKLTDEQIRQFKMNAGRAAVDLNAEKNGVALLHVVESLI